MNYKKIKLPGTDTSRISLSKHQLGVTGVALYGSIPQKFPTHLGFSDHERVAMEISNFRTCILTHWLRDKRLQTRLPQIMIGVIRRGVG
jgi:hypothetical protein